MLGQIEQVTREVPALLEATAEHPSAKPVILTLEFRLPFPPVPQSFQLLPAWQWMLDGMEAE